jgi:hypothetical protein
MNITTLYTKIRGLTSFPVSTSNHTGILRDFTSAFAMMDGVTSTSILAVAMIVDEHSHTYSTSLSFDYYVPYLTRPQIPQEA